MQDVIHTAQITLGITMFIFVMKLIINGFKLVAINENNEAFVQATSQIITSGIGMVLGGVATLCLQILCYAEGIEMSKNATEMSSIFNWIVVYTFFGGLICLLFTIFNSNEKTKDSDELFHQTHVELIQDEQANTQEENQIQAITELERMLHLIHRKY